MPLPHFCEQCGFDLTRVRPRTDPVYRLPLVLCPQCDAACVRRRHPLNARWRQIRRALASCWVLAWQLALLCSLPGAVVALALLLAELQADGDIHGRSMGAMFSLGIATGLSIFAGIWLTLGFGHWRRWMAWLMWSGLLALVMLGSHFAVAGAHHGVGSVPELLGAALAEHQEFLRRFAWLAGSVCLTGLVMVFARPLRRLWVR
ncbi:MAG: hypothetical protein ACF8NJ_02450, partial [Phycisphaerales bacterium JB038]